MRAERERRAAVTNAEAGKRAAILESEGQREAQVRKAEGEKEAAILRAEGMAAARLAMAQAEAEAIQRITAALPEGQAAMYLLGLKYLEALPAITQGKGTTIFLPAEATGVMGALGGMRELLRSTAGAGAAAGGSDQPTYQPPAARPAFKSLKSPADNADPTKEI
jgi:regulator of protease activity HflC (stomatin/prohibitin superfamily)